MDIERIDQLILRLREDLPIEERVQVSTALFELTGKRYGSDFQAWNKWRGMQGSPAGKSSMVSDLPYVKHLLNLKVLDAALLSKVDASKLPAEGEPDSAGWEALVAKAGRYVTLFESGNFYSDATAEQIARVHGKEARVEPVAGGGGRVLCVGGNRFELGDRAHLMARRALAFELGDPGERRMLVDHALRLWLLQDEAYRYMIDECGFRFYHPDGSAEEHAGALGRLGVPVPELEFGDEVWVEAFADEDPGAAMAALLDYHGAGAVWSLDDDGFAFDQHFVRWLRQDLGLGPLIGARLEGADGWLAVPDGTQALINFGQSLAESQGAPWRLVRLPRPQENLVWLLKVPRDSAAEVAECLGGELPRAKSLRPTRYGLWRRLFGPRPRALTHKTELPEPAGQAPVSLQALVPSDRWASIEVGEGGSLEIASVVDAGESISKGALDGSRLAARQRGPKASILFQGRRRRLRLDAANSFPRLIRALNQVATDQPDRKEPEHRFVLLAETQPRLAWVDPEAQAKLRDAGFAVISGA